MSESNKTQGLSLVAVGVGLGFSIVLPILFFVWLGRRLDERRRGNTEASRLNVLTSEGEEILKPAG